MTYIHLDSCEALCFPSFGLLQDVGWTVTTYPTVDWAGLTDLAPE
jgi:hypothetical protein